VLQQHLPGVELHAEELARDGIPLGRDGRVAASGRQRQDENTTPRRTITVDYAQPGQPAGSLPLSLTRVCYTSPAFTSLRGPVLVGETCFPRPAWRSWSRGVGVRARGLIDRSAAGARVTDGP
jgi:hypothetical protein